MQEVVVAYDGSTGRALAEIINQAGRDVGWLAKLFAGAGRRSQARWKAREDQRASQAQQKKWLEQVSRQMARGTAGDASQEDARAALQGRGGKPSDLDDKWF
jgi:hypothetical protein